MVDLRQAVAGIAPQLVDKAESFGSLIYRFGALDVGNVFGATVVQRIGYPISFHFDSDDLDETERFPRIEGIWWLRNASATDYVILANSSSKPLQVSATLTDLSNGKHSTTIALGPRQSTRINVRELASRTGLSSQWGAVTLVVLSKTASLSAAGVVLQTDYDLRLAAARAPLSKIKPRTAA